MICSDCANAWLVWAIRVGRVVRAVESRVSSQAKVDRLVVLLKTEEWSDSPVYLKRWAEKVGVPA